MKILVRKTKSVALLKAELIIGAVVMAVAMVGLPISMAILEASLLTNPLGIAVALGGMLMFGLVGYFCCIRPYLLYRKTPDVLAEADDEFLYIHANKEAKIPLASLTYATVRFELPFMWSEGFMKEIVIHLVSERYGDVILETPDFGNYKMRFAAQAEAASDVLIRFIDDAMNNPK